MAAKSEGGISKVKLAVGAASLFLFIVGVKRTFRTEDGSEVRNDGLDGPPREVGSAR